MILPTREDVEQLMALVEHQKEIPYPLFADERADRLKEKLKNLLDFYDKRGLSIGEVDIYLLGEVPGRKQLTQMHSFAVGDKYTLLPEDEEPVSTYYNYNLGDEPGVADEVDDWKIQDIRAHPKTE